VEILDNVDVAEPGTSPPQQAHIESRVGVYGVADRLLGAVVRIIANGSNL
jgi:hypothetical protein